MRLNERAPVIGMRQPVSGAILAGGQSRRMGFNKALIEIDGRTIISRAAEVMSTVFPDPVIIANDPTLYGNLGLPVYPDEIQGAGSLGGIYTALKRSKTQYVFICACDMPWLDRACIERVLEAIDGSDCVVPFVSGRLHPMHAAWSKGCADRIEAVIRSGNLRINDLMRGLALRRLSTGHFGALPIERSVENVNTRDDLERNGLDGGR